jgi:hypothetical protein
MRIIMAATNYREFEDGMKIPLCHNTLRVSVFGWETLCPPSHSAGNVRRPGYNKSFSDRVAVIFRPDVHFGSLRSNTLVECDLIEVLYHPRDTLF